MTEASLAPSREACTARIRATGARATPARVAVLRLLEGAERALSHHDIETALADAGFDRVTLYRVLDWLVESGLALRTTDAQRVFRFSAAAAGAPEHTGHAHFRCDGCGKMFCLEDVQISNPALPRGFSGRSVEFCVTGHCARCEEDDKGGEQQASAGKNA
jgi:Fur family transcriptional regulator, ferric uptake regulator